MTTLASRISAPPATIGSYLIERLGALGVRHIFGIPGDYILGLYKMIEDGPIELVGVTREDAAGFAADAYARINGLGCAAVTYCVGGLSLCNSIAGAFAEKSPVVVVGGAPGVSERGKDLLLHHKVKRFDTQLKVMEELTVAAAVLDDPRTAQAEIDRVLGAAVRYKRPVYLELPRDMYAAKIEGRHEVRRPIPPSDPDALREALDETVAMLQAARRPMILADVEVHRFGLQDDLTTLAESTGLTIATTILGKSVISEAHPRFAGLYEAAMGRPEVTEFVESSDCLLMLGCFLTDINLGIFTHRLDPSRCIDATSEGLRIRHHHYHDVRLDDYIAGLIARAPRVERLEVPRRPVHPASKWTPRAGAPVTVARLFERLNLMLDESTVVIADTGLSLFGASDLSMTRRTEFLGPAYYTSMGFAVPAALGAGLANRSLRPIVVVGDGAFQMTGLELSTIVRQGLNPIVVILNNKGYTTERFLLEGGFNDILDWKYHRIPEVLGAGLGLEVRDEEGLEAALVAALANTGSFSLLNVDLEPLETTPSLQRLADGLGARIRSSAASEGGSI